MEYSDFNNVSFVFLRILFNNCFQIIHLIAWRFIFSALIISPFILAVIAVRIKFSPALRSVLLAACLFGLFLPFQRSVMYSSDRLFLIITDAAARGIQIPNIIGAYGFFDIYETISFLWFFGFVIFYVKRYFDYRKTIQMFNEGKVQTCASYFHRFRSKIYVPPNFETAYTPQEQEMLLAHERQHIAQHDPFMYRFFVILECVCWFNPLIFIAVRHFQHERELLCDKRVTQHFSDYDYGKLILKAEKEKKTAIPVATAGIVMEFGSTAERLSTILKPVKTTGKITALVLILFTAVQLIIGFMGFQPAYKSLNTFSEAIVVEEFGLKELEVYTIENFDVPIVFSSYQENPGRGEAIEGMNGFITASESALLVDEKAMYDYAVSLGLSEDTCLRIVHIYNMRLDMGGLFAGTDATDFTVGDLKTDEIDKIYPRDTFASLTGILF